MADIVTSSTSEVLIEKTNAELVKPSNQITALLDFITPRSKIHVESKKMINSLKTVYNRFLNVMEVITIGTVNVPNLKTTDTQTSPRTINDSARTRK